jgi:FkbM family methyltransferase
MRKLLNKLLRPLGYRIERFGRFNHEIERLTRRPGGFKFVQIGANDGVRFDGLFGIVTNHNCSGIVVEPLPDMFERLRVNYADYPRIVPINKAVHESARSLPLFRLSPGALSRYPGWTTGIASFDRNHLRRHGVAEGDILSETVPCIPLMELLAQTNMLDVDLLQIDTEGYDAAIVRMIDFSRCRPRLIKYENKNLSGEERRQLLALLATHRYRSVAEGTDCIAWRN